LGWRGCYTWHFNFWSIKRKVSPRFHCIRRPRASMTISASIISLSALALSSVFVVIVVCVSRVSDTHAPVFYITAIEELLTLALFAMMVALSESCLSVLVALLALRIENSCSAEKAALAYFTAAKNELEEDAPGHKLLQAAQLEVCDGMNKLLKARLDELADLGSLCAKLGSLVDSHTSTATPPSEPSAAGPAVESAEKLGGDASHAASSCSAADTASV